MALAGMQRPLHRSGLAWGVSHREKIVCRMAGAAKGAASIGFLRIELKAHGRAAAGMLLWGNQISERPRQQLADLDALW